MLRMLRSLLRGLSLLLLAGLILTPFTQIILRGVFNVPMAGAEEMARYMLICLTLMAGALVTLQGGQIKMEEFQALLPEKPRWLVQLAVETAGVVVFGFLALAAGWTISQNMNNQTATLEMPFWLFMAPLALGMAFLAGETAVHLGAVWRRGRADDKHTTLT